MSARYHLERMAHYAAEALRMYDEGNHDEAWIDFKKAREQSNALLALNREARAAVERMEGGS